MSLLHLCELRKISWILQYAVHDIHTFVCIIHTCVTFTVHMYTYIHTCMYVYMYVLHVVCGWYIHVCIYVYYMYVCHDMMHRIMYVCMTYIICQCHVCVPGI